MLLITDCLECGNDKYDGYCGYCMTNRIKQLEAELSRANGILECVRETDRLLAESDYKREANATDET